MVGLPRGGTITVPATVRAYTPAVTGLPATFYQYCADLTDLQPDEEYTYSISLNGMALTTVPASFRTAKPGKFSFLVFGDSGLETQQQRTLVSRMAAEAEISFLMHTGDLVYPHGSFASYESKYFGANAQLFRRLPVFPTPGNHDYLGDSGVAYLASHRMPDRGVDPADAGRYYSFDWGNAHFTCLDSNLIYSQAGDRMLAWLENDLAATHQFWKIVFFHHPPYPTGHHAGDVVCAAMRDTVIPLIEGYGVQLVLSGHEHAYQRTTPLSGGNEVPEGTGTIYVTSGGGGADLHDVNCGGVTATAVETYHYLRIDLDGEALTVRATSLDGAEIERFVLRPKPALRRQGVVSTGDYSAAVAPGSLVSIFGRNFAASSKAASAMPLPLELVGVQVRVDGQDCPLLFVSPDQINTQIPYGISAATMLEVLTGNGSTKTSVSILPTAPSILVVTTNEASATFASLQAGRPVIVFLTGLGACSQTTTAGNAVSTPVGAIAPVEVWLADWKIQPSYSGLTPGFSGVYQVNFTVSAAIPAGTYPLRIATADAVSRAVPFVVE